MMMDPSVDALDDSDDCRCRHLVGATWKLAPITWNLYKYVQEQQGQGGAVDPLFVAHRIMDMELCVVSFYLFRSIRR